MNRALKVTLQVVFLAVLIWVLAALSGVVAGFTVQVGAARRGRGHGRRRARSFRWTDTGMSAELTPTNAGMQPTAGIPLMRY
jgi:hypothetical protein